MGHRQKYTSIKVTGIKAPGAKKKADKVEKDAKDAKTPKAKKTPKASDDAGDQEA
jgi:hypothetical protein